MFLMWRRLTSQQFLLTAVIGVYLAFGFFHLNQFITADEHYWLYERIPKYWDAWSEQQWKKTYINDKPGVSLAFISGAGLWFFPEPEHVCTTTEKVITCQPDKVSQMLLAFRVPLLLFNAGLILLGYFLAQKLLDRRIALWFACFLATAPMIIGMSQIVNPDALLWSTGMIALLAFLLALTRTQWRFLFLSGLFLGLALLSKYTASYLIVFAMLLILLRPFFESSTDPKILLRCIVKDTLTLGITLGIASLSIAILLPDVFIRPQHLLFLLSGGEARFILYPVGLFLIFFLLALATNGRLLSILKSIFIQQQILLRSSQIINLILLLTVVLLILGHHLHPTWELFEKVPFDLKNLYSNEKLYPEYQPNFFQSFLLELNPLVFSLSPVLLFLWLWQLFSGSFAIRRTTTTIALLNFLLPLFVYGFLLALILSKVLAIPRYLMMLYPIVALHAALGVPTLIDFLQNRYKGRWTHLLPVGIMLSLILSLIGSVPFMANYTSALLPPHRNIQHAWGYGGYEAAQYLNQLPNAKSITLWSDYFGVCEFFVGRCVTDYNFNKETVIPNYYVLTQRGKIRYISFYRRWERLSGLRAYQYYDNPHPVWSLIIGQRPTNSIRVFQVEPLPPL